MSNTILTPNIIANEALDVLRTNAVMANLVHRDYSSEFVAGVGDTITVRKPATFEAKEFTTEVEVQDATEGKVPVKMDKLLDVTFAVTSKELTMGIVDFRRQDRRLPARAREGRHEPRRPHQGRHRRGRHHRRP